MPVLLPEAVTVLVPVALALALVGLVVGWLGLRRAARLEAHYRALMTGVDGPDLAAALEAYVARLAASERRLSALEAGQADIGARLRRALQRVRVLRYNAYDDAGGEQSFALALLDDAADGVVMSSLVGRAGVRVFAKPVAGGRSAIALTTEEERVLTEAAGQPPSG
jgi:hypothetical protein